MITIPWNPSEVNFNLVGINIPGLAVIPTDYKIAYISSQGGLYVYCDTSGANGSQDLQYQVAECDISITKKS